MGVGVVGAGWVGKSMIEMFPEAVVYDEPLMREQYAEELIPLERKAINMCDVVFLCVPTPNKRSGKLDISIIEDVLSWCAAEIIVMRSTVNPGDCDKLKKKFKKRIVTQPEYLGETIAHPLLDQTDRPFIIIGGDPSDRRKVIETYQGVYNANTKIRQVTNLEAEVIKLSENRAIAHKVAECQELYDVCELAGVDYYTVREAVYGDDPRFNLWFSFVYPERRGMDSKCIPKDPWAWCAWAESLGYQPKVTNAILDKNKEWVRESA